MRKILFLDRDGCIIEEPLPDFQIDSLDKLRFVPGALYALARLARETDYEFVLVTNQDGMGTDAFPESNFWPAHERMLHTLEGVGVHFKAIHIDRSFPHEQLPTRKPGTAMLTPCMDGSVDMANSRVVGDRLTDGQLARNLGARAILLRNTKMIEAGLPGYRPEEQPDLPFDLIADNWEAIYQHLKCPPRRASWRRTTRETDIEVELCIDGTGKSNIHTGIGFFDHMLDQLARHGLLDLTIHARGDLHIDEHHTIEDTALTLGETFARALGDKRGTERYGFCLPMDDALAEVALDFGGRPWVVWEADFRREKIGDMPTEMFYHFFKSFSDAARCNLHIRCSGENEHHKIESIFKAFAKSIKMAVRRDPQHLELPSTKGVL